MNAALTLISRHGVHATPMSAIAKEAGTGMGTIYNYYANKEQLINDIYSFIKQQEAGLFGTFSSALPIKTQFETFYTTTLAFFGDNPRYFHFMDQLQASPLITEESKAVGRKAITGVLQLLEAGKQARIIKRINTEELLQFIGGSVLSYVRWTNSTKAKVNQTSLRHQLTMVWDAIKE